MVCDCACVHACETASERVPNRFWSAPRHLDRSLEYKGLSHMSKSKPTLDMAALGTGVAIMTVVGLLDGLADQNAAGKAVRAGWKTTLGVAGLYLNISNFSSGQFQNDKFLYAYLGSMVAVGAATLYLSKKG